MAAVESPKAAPLPHPPRSESRLEPFSFAALLLPEFSGLGTEYAYSFIQFLSIGRLVVR
jgi:hypothetical protein